MSPTSPDSRRSARAPYGRALVAVVLLLTLTASGAAVLPQQTGRVDLLSQPSLRIDGAAALDQAGASVAGAGDVNGDGLDDLLVGAPERGPLDAGAAYVVFGRETPENVDLGALGRDGFRITGAAGDDRAGVAVAGAGDVNGDGLDDVLVGADLADNNGRSDSGSAYVVFGRRAADNVDLADLGEAGFRIDGAASSDEAGASVAAAGDMNGDGLDDLLVGAPGGGLLFSAGAAYVVFGQETSTNVDLDALGAGGFQMTGIGFGGEVGSSVAAAGDVNRDGRPDVLVGAPLDSLVYVVFGQEIPADVDLSALGRGGFTIVGPTGARAGISVASAGDVNADGRPDILIGADEGGLVLPAFGSAYVVHGPQAPTDVDLAVLGGSGVRVRGAAEDDEAGVSVAGAGDLNGDGRPEVLVSAPGADNNGRSESGTVYALAGDAAANVDLGALPAGSLRIDGATAGDRAGGSVAAAGDVNGDGRPDIVVGAALANNNDLGDSGSAYVVFGFGTPELAYPAVDATVGAPLSVLPMTLRRTGPAGFSISPPLPAGLALDAATGEVAGRPTQALPRTTFTVTMTDLAGSARAPLVLQVAAP